jgi:Cyclic nucleotide-binding domain
MTKLKNSGAGFPPTQLWAARPQPLEAQVNSCSGSGSLERMGAAVCFPRDGAIYRENTPATYLYKVISGTVRTYKALSEGRRQIVAFYMTGDIFGLEAGEVHAFSAEAIAAA